MNSPCIPLTSNRHCAYNRHYLPKQSAQLRNSTCRCKLVGTVPTFQNFSVIVYGYGRLSKSVRLSATSKWL
ncbi:hypothetical protein KC19_5G135800 [Ceratodon purpureus]|uniref:Uncharacterized protein n=1 Tax=Ceratodon purpureus TaxID=3225 RepID=A0A8T0I214_CERPU|nr:hypothetical protein KC19_5G135800 [Ceratodon purpureus]